MLRLLLVLGKDSLRRYLKLTLDLAVFYLAARTARKLVGDEDSKPRARVHPYREYIRTRRSAN